MQVKSSVSGQTCGGATQHAYQGQFQRPRRHPLTARYGISFERSWTGTSICARQPPLLLPRQRNTCRCAAGSGSSSDSVAEQRRVLEAMFSATPAEITAEPEEESVEDLRNDPARQIIRDLPLWRVPWTALPGTQEFYHVHEPHYCHMFETIVAGPKPWRFGHLYLPDGSVNLVNEAYALKHGTSAALVGTLMEVMKMLRCPDGRLIVLAAGLGRNEVLQQKQATPFNRADVQLLPDDEEAEVWTPLIDHVLAPMVGDAAWLTVTQAGAAAGHAAAVASAKVWQQYDIERLVGLDWGGEAVQDASTDALKLARQRGDLSQVEAIDLVEPLLALPLQGQQSSPTASGWMERLAAVQAEAVEAGKLAATMAAGSIVKSDGGSAAVLRDGSSGPGNSDIPLSVRQLEKMIWTELDAISIMAKRLQRGSLQLSAAFRSFRPDPAEQQTLTAAVVGSKAEATTSNGDESPATSDEDGELMSRLVEELPLGKSGDDYVSRDYPPLLRAQRLSYAMAVIMPNARQALLEAPSIKRRFELSLRALREHRKVLAALTSLETLEDV